MNAHWQNGVAERRIREQAEHARTMLIHAHKRWPTAINAHLWPYALRMANNNLNCTPNLKRKFVPMEAFSGTRTLINPKHYFPFGYPVYALQDDLQAGKNASQWRWQERSRIGIYLGHSPHHAQSVSLVLFLQSGLVSPQFHVTMDPGFKTMRQTLGDQLPQSLWQEKCHFLQVTQDPSDVPSPVEGSQASEGGQVLQMPQQHQEQSMLPPPVPEQQQQQQEELPPEESHPIIPPEGDDGPAPLPALRRSQRQCNAPSRLIEMMTSELEHPTEHFVAYEALAMPQYQHQHDLDDPITYLASTSKKSSDPDTMYLHQALNQPDKRKFVKAMQKEVTDQFTKKHWVIVKKSDVPQGSTILPGVWSCKCKRRIATGEPY